MTKSEKTILSLLQDNARLSTADLAQRANISEAEVKKTIAKLEKSGVIVNYTLVVDEGRLDSSMKKVRALVELRVRPEKKKGYTSLARRITRHRQVIDHYLISGQYDFLIVVEGQDMQEISNFVSEKLASLENVTSTVTHFVMQKYKEKGVAIGDEAQVDRLAVAV